MNSSFVLDKRCCFDWICTVLYITALWKWKSDGLGYKSQECTVTNEIWTLRKHYLVCKKCTVYETHSFSYCQILTKQVLCIRFWSFRTILRQEVSSYLESKFCSMTKSPQFRYWCNYFEIIEPLVRTILNTPWTWNLISALN